MRYSLRSLFVVVTLVSLSFGCYIHFGEVIERSIGWWINRVSADYHFPTIILPTEESKG